MTQNTARGITRPLAMAFSLGVMPAQAQVVGGGYPIGVGSGTSLITIVQNISTMITGPFGISAIIVAVAGSCIAAALHFIPGRHIFTTIGCGGMAFTSAWLVNNYLV